MFRVEIETDNDAYAGEDLGSALANDLRDLARKLDNATRLDLSVMARTGKQFRIRDTNGNPVGFARITGVEDPTGDDA